MKNKLSHFQLARLICEDLARFLSTGTVLTRHAQLALFIAANQASAERQLSDFMIGDPTPEADAVANAWSVLCAGLGLIQAAAAVDGAAAVLEGWQERERKRPEWLQVQCFKALESEKRPTAGRTPSSGNGVPQGDERGSSERPQVLS